MFKSKVDSLFASEWNKDVNYFSNIVESTSRDLHCFFIQSNTSKYGDSRITLPKKTENKNLIQVKGGKNNVLLVDDINLSDLRNFQLGDYSIQLNENTEFKPVPPDFRIEDTRKRINNEIFFPEND
ncbi:MAG: hypothetical protein K0U66_01225 [Gammaproteobacteria bacterium]|nr:hypothetical protein [Gammaproteobacteria bacterium]